MIAYQKGSQPFVNWNHIDGPMLVCVNGTVHWLTVKERISLRIGLITAEAISNGLGKSK